MQQEIEAAMPAVEIDLLGINAPGLEAGNASICMNRTIPWLQDTAADDVWTLWNVTFRDVVVLDATNETLFVYNLTQHNLADQMNYDELKTLLLDAAASQMP